MAIRTRARAKVEEDIAALAKEVSALRRTRGAGMPDVDTLVGFVVAAFGHERARELALAADDCRGMAWVWEAVSKLQLAPAAEELRARVVTACQAVDQSDLPAFKRASQQLREAVLALLEARAGKWRQLSAAGEFYPPSWQSTRDPVEHVRAAVPKLTRWEVLVWSGHALACAMEDVWRWRFWQAGRREQGEDSLQRGHSAVSEKQWQQEVAQHTLPEAEALIVDSWPVPPDADWPEDMKSSLSRLREWQAKQGALEAALEMVAEGSSAQ